MGEKRENRKPWLKQPGELHDMRGVPIYHGDLIKTYHFTDRRRGKRYLYHTAVYAQGCMRMVPTSHLEPTMVNSGGECLMVQASLAQSEVIHGYGPGRYLDYTERPKVAAALLSN